MLSAEKRARYFAEFERLGVEKVRAEYNSDRYHSDQWEAARQFLVEHDKEKEKREQKIHTNTSITLVVACLTLMVSIVMLFTYFYELLGN